jgi:tripartite-type tricarboxylate transporter receptor subunit TctC
LKIRNNRWKLHLPGLASVLLLVFSTGLAAQTFPNRPIFLYWPQAPGRPTEAAFRAMANEAGKLLGQPMIVEPRPGAGGRLPVTSLASAVADGHVLGAAFDAILAVTPLASASFRVQPGRDYAPVMLVNENPLLMFGHPSLPFRDVPGLVAYARANPGKLNFGSSGIGSTSHIHWERLMARTGIQLLHVPYKGIAQALPDMLAGIVQLWIGVPDAGYKSLMESGKLVPIAATGSQRLSDYPNTPTLEEAGLKGLVLIPWGGIVAPPGTPRDTIEKLNGAFKAALKMPEVVRQMQVAGFSIIGSSPEEFSARIKADLEGNAPIVRRLNLSFD